MDGVNGSARLGALSTCTVTRLFVHAPLSTHWFLSPPPELRLRPCVQPRARGDISEAHMLFFERAQVHAGKADAARLWCSTCLTCCLHLVPGQGLSPRWRHAQRLRHADPSLRLTSSIIQQRDLLLKSPAPKSAFRSPSASLPYPDRPGSGQICKHQLALVKRLELNVCGSSDVNGSPTGTQEVAGFCVLLRDSGLVQTGQCGR